MVGGGLAGLITAIQLARNNAHVIVVERKEYPFHRVCGEYISNETVPFLKTAGIFPSDFGPAAINRLQLTSVNGKSAEMGLDLGGFGISRYTFDHFLYKKAIQDGVTFQLSTEVTDIKFRENSFAVTAGGRVVFSNVVVCSHGKRSRLDHALGRDFVRRRSPYTGVKYHIRSDQPDDLISLHNFNNGYCGISRVEGGISNLCYLTHRDSLKKHGSLSSLEENVLCENPFLKHIFRNAEFLFDKPEVINEISFETKGPIEGHLLLTGDAAGMITPLCGNGMAMAIHSGKIAGEWVTRFLSGEISRAEMEQGYGREWRRRFSRRLWIGRQVQRLFGSPNASNLAVALARNSRSLTDLLVARTHGEPF